MFARTKIALGCAGLICIAVASTTNNASAVTAEVARKCSALTAKAFLRARLAILRQAARKERGQTNENILESAQQMGVTWVTQPREVSDYRHAQSLPRE